MRLRSAFLLLSINILTMASNTCIRLLSGSDAEGAGEMFKVSTLDTDNIPKNEAGQTDYSKDFFGKETNLTVRVS